MTKKHETLFNITKKRETHSRYMYNKTKNAKHGLRSKPKKKERTPPRYNVFFLKTSPCLKPVSWLLVFILKCGSCLFLVFLKHVACLLISILKRNSLLFLYIKSRFVFRGFYFVTCFVWLGSLILKLALS